VRIKDPKKEFPRGPEYIAGVMAIYPHKYYSKVGPEGMAINRWETGPYKGVEVIPGQKHYHWPKMRITLASPKGNASIGKLHIRFISEVNTQIGRTHVRAGGLAMAGARTRRRNLARCQLPWKLADYHEGLFPAF